MLSDYSKTHLDCFFLDQEQKHEPESVCSAQIPARRSVLFWNDMQQSLKTDSRSWIRFFLPGNVSTGGGSLKLMSTSFRSVSLLTECCMWWCTSWFRLKNVSDQRWYWPSENRLILARKVIILLSTLIYRKLLNKAKQKNRKLSFASKYLTWFF